jgi:hypothetical protein
MTDLTKVPTDSDSKTRASQSYEADFTSQIQHTHPPPTSVATDVVTADDIEQRAKDNLTKLAVEEASHVAEDKPPKESTMRRKPNSVKPDIQTLEQFIAYVYSRKGQPVVLSSKTDRLIALGPRLDNDAKVRLLELAQKDILLAVPRQLLLVTLQTQNSKVRGELREFVSEALRKHTAFSSEPMLAALKNLSDSPPLEKALELAASTSFAAGELQERPPKSGDIAKMRKAAAYTMAIWFAVTRDTSLAEVSRGLFSALWQPQNGKKQSEHARLRDLTQISDLAGVGVACQSFKEEAERQAALAQSARREKEWALERVSSLERDVERSRQMLAEKDQTIEELNRNLSDQKADHENILTLQRDEFQHLRGRLLRRLRSEVSLLDEALYALRKVPPKVDVMDDHAERVVEALRTEIKSLEEAE